MHPIGWGLRAGASTLASVVAAVAMIASGAAQAQQQRQWVIATGGTGGVYYPLGGGLANILAKNIPGVTATAQVTGGSVDNLRLLGVKKADIGFSQVDAAWDAINGLDKFTNGKLDIKALAVLYPNHMHAVTVASTGIKSVTQKKGRRVSTGSTGSATEVFANRVLEAAGLDHTRDIRKERLGVAESVNALKDNKIESFFWVGGLPTAAVTDLAATPNTRIVMIDFADLAAKMNAKYGPLYSATTIPQATYKGMEADNRNIAVWNILAVSGATSDSQAYEITKVLFDKQADLALVHAEGRNFNLQVQTKANAGIPFHPGAARYLAEKGVKFD
jgi:TRAP transporter TAXI family solute receptor